MERPESNELDDLLASVDEFRKAEATLQELKQKIARKAHGLAAIADKKSRIAAGAYAYWYAPEVNAKDIAFGITGQLQPYTLLKLAGPVSAGIPCDRCHEDLPIRSRAQMKGTLDRIRDNHPSSEGYRVLCPPCEEAVREERLQAYLQETERQRAWQRELERMPYRQYLETPDWQNALYSHLWHCVYLAHALECETCDAGDGLGVYHKSAEDIGRSDDLVLLCTVCRDALIAAGKLAGEPCELNLVTKTLARQILQAHRDRIESRKVGIWEPVASNG